MNSKMYVVVIIWLMYFPRGKITLFEKFHYLFVMIPDEDETLRIFFLKKQPKLRTSVSMPKMNKLLKQNAKI